jgi:glycosyltransferase involved in cell wall biosynthesis
MLAILTTHPIQYQVPLWQALAKDGKVPFEVWYLSDHGVRSSFDSEFNQSFAWDLDMLSGYPSRFLKANSNHDVSRFSQLRLVEPLGNLLRAKNVESLWIQGWQVAAYWQAVWQAQAAGVPVWLRGESNDLAPIPFWKKAVKGIALQRLFSRTSEFLYIGKANRRFYESYGISDLHLHPAFYCVDNARFSSAADKLRPQRADIRRSWGIPEDAFCILFSGKFINKKRPFDVVSAVEQLHQIIPERQTHLLFAGSGNLGDALRQRCHVVFDAELTRAHPEFSSNGDRPPASFTGFLNQTEISKAYVAADCLVLPSDHRETWGLVVNEAMASGLPCVVSDACGCGEDLIEPIATEFRYPMGDTRSLAIAIGEMIKRPTTARLFKQHVSGFDLSASVKTVSDLYRQQNQVGAVTKIA